ncbi:protein of unknown function [Tepidibacter aestuarii]|nr:protein of unknown function [Tepidibacter aestuarii]
MNIIILLLIVGKRSFKNVIKSGLNIFPLVYFDRFTAQKNEYIDKCGRNH